MLNLVALKAKKEKESNNNSNNNKTTAADLRLQKDLADLNLPDNMSIYFPEGNDKLLNFEIIIVPREGFYRDGRFVFSFNIPPGYPHEPPKVKCITKVYHPNIDLQGNICLNILREDWRPVLSITSIVYGLHFVLIEPNTEDPLNKEAAQMIEKGDRQFEAQVQRSIHYGCHIDGEYFPPCAK